MFDIETYVKEWFTQNQMNPVFAISEFCRLHKVEARIKNNEVVFVDEREHTDIGKLLDGNVFQIDTWKLLRNQNVRGTESSTEQPKSVRVSQK